jgi:hypothetical protein
MISPGSVVRVWQTANTAWVVVRPWPDGRLYLLTKSVDDAGHASYTARVAGRGDVIEVSPAPVYQPGQTVKHDGIPYEVIVDKGDAVEMLVPQSRFVTAGGSRLKMPAGNHAEIAKSDLVLGKL